MNVHFHPPGCEAAPFTKAWVSLPQSWAGTMAHAQLIVVIPCPNQGLWTPYSDLENQLFQAGLRSGINQESYQKAHKLFLKSPDPWPLQKCFCNESHAKCFSNSLEKTSGFAKQQRDIHICWVTVYEKLSTWAPKTLISTDHTEIDMETSIEKPSTNVRREKETVHLFSRMTFDMPGGSGVWGAWHFGPAQKNIIRKW